MSSAHRMFGGSLGFRAAAVQRDASSVAVGVVVATGDPPVSSSSSMTRLACGAPPACLPVLGIAAKGVRAGWLA